MLYLARMDNELLSTEIKLVNEQHNVESLEKIIIKMQPLIKKYIRKLYFMEKDDASQELTLSLIDAIYHLKSYTNDAMCLSYLQKSIINKYYYLCKSNIKLNSFNDMFAEIPDTIPYVENFNDIEFLIDVEELLKNKNDLQKYFVKYALLYNLSDREIAVKLDVSRQYINRVKKKILNDLFQDTKQGIIT